MFGAPNISMQSLQIRREGPSETGSSDEIGGAEDLEGKWDTHSVVVEVA